MNETNSSINKIWANYLKSINEDIINTSKTYTSWCFGGSEECSNELTELVSKPVDNLV